MPSIEALPIDNQPKDLSISDFRSIVDSHGSLARSCRFIARIVPTGSLLTQMNAASSDMTKDLQYLCEATEYPGRGFNNIEPRYYGPGFKLPFQTTYEDHGMTFICRSKSKERQFFDDWMALINPISSFDFNYRDEYSANIEIFQFSEVAEDGSFNSTGFPYASAIYHYTILNAWPVLVNPQQLTWADSDFLRLSVSFTYTKWMRKYIQNGFDVPASGNNTFTFVPPPANVIL